MVALENLLVLPPITKPLRYIGLGLQVGRPHIRFRFNPTRDGVSFGPVIEGYDVHVTVFEKNGIFHSHLTYAERGWKRPIHEPIVTMSKEEVVKALIREYERSRSELLERYDEYDEALVATDEWWKLLQDLLKRVIVVDVNGQRLFINLKLGYLIDNAKVLEKKAMEAGRLFKVGTVAEALRNNPLGERWLLSPDLRPIVMFDDEVYIFRQNPMEILDSLRSKASSLEEFFEELRRSELRAVAKFAEVLGLERLFVEVWRRNLLEKLLPPLT